MVNNMYSEYHYVVTDESELDELLSGRKTYQSMPWNRWLKPFHLRPGSTGVVWLRGKPDAPVHPLVLICHEDDIRRLCGRYAQLHSDLSPLTAWCHLLTPQFVEPLDSMVRTSDLSGMEASWTGLVVAEAVLLAERPIANIRISACLATQSFAIARTNALWSNIPIEDVVRRFDKANRLCRNGSAAQRLESRAEKIRSSLDPIWGALAAFSQNRISYRSRDLEPIVAALQALQRARAIEDKEEANQLIKPLLSYVPEADMLRQLTELSPEMRLRLFDKLVDGLNDSQSENAKLRRNVLAFLAGYLVTIAAGGSPSLSLAESHALRWPEITAWAYLIGGIGERVIWTSSFDGLGRLVARELLRPLRLDESPMCDFAFDEAAVLADSKLADPLVHLRIKQARLVTVALYPGVNISIPIADTTSQGAGKTEPNRASHAVEPSIAPREPMNVLVDALWPYLLVRIDDYIRSAIDREEGTLQYPKGSQRDRSKRKPSSQTQLPISGPKR